MRSGELEVQSVLIVENLKGYVVIEANDPQVMFMATQGLRHVKGQLRGELEFSEIENYLVKKSTVSELAVDGTVEVIGGPFKGMKATITRVDHDKEEATVILLDAPYQLPPINIRSGSADKLVFPVPDKPKNNAVSPSLPIFAEQCIGKTLFFGIK